jgi:hypothetical protein
VKRVKQAFDFADGTENVAILVFGTVVEEECPHVQNEKLTDWTARLLEVILEETGQDGHDLTSALKAYSSEEGRQRGTPLFEVISLTMLTINS